jgi:BirA family biotin operon repressor/biotin-[acetyl-CoA-carboxylase] ligase
MTRRDQEAALLGALFRASGDWIGPGELARTSGLSPEEIPGALAPYRASGYPIEFHPQGGVRLQAPPDVWSAEEILGRCPPAPGAPAWNPLLLNETASTSDVAREQAGKGAAAGFVVAAARQTRGRGRLGRRWESAGSTSPSCSGRNWPRATPGN